jgi:gliding motility-associated lipoprotein GldH
MLKRVLIALALIVYLSSCNKIGLFEKVFFTPKQQWIQSFQPEINFDITDTSSSYLVYFTVRHADAFAFNNLWIKVYSKMPGDSLEKQERFDIPLADGKQWLGSGMDDIFNHRVLLYRTPVKFAKPGEYYLRIAHDMRIDPVEFIFNVGIRIEKVK